MELQTEDSINLDQYKKNILELKKEEAILKDLLKKYNDIKNNPGQKVFIPLVNNSKIAFFEGKTKNSNICFFNIGEYVLETTIDRKINRIDKSLSQIQTNLNNLNKKSNQNTHLEKEEKKIKRENFESNMIYNDKNEKIGELKKLNEDLFEIIEDEIMSNQYKINPDKENKPNEKIDSLEKDKKDATLQHKLEELKNSRNKYKDPNFISFADLEFL